MERLTGVAELLDGPLDDDEAVVANLRDLARLNRLTGGVRLSVAAIRTLAGDRLPGSILDVGAGGADIPVALLAAARREGAILQVTAVDSRQEILAAARRVRPGINRLDGLALALGDGRALPYPDASFDVAHASLVLHHLEPADAIAFLAELRRVARVGIVVNDLVRGRLALVGAWLLVHSIATARFTRNDGPLSVRRAYSRAELDDLLQSAGALPVRTVVGFAGHRVAIAAR